MREVGRLDGRVMEESNMQACSDVLLRSLTCFLLNTVMQWTLSPFFEEDSVSYTCPLSPW